MKEQGREGRSEGWGGRKEMGGREGLPMSKLDYYSHLWYLLVNDSCYWHSVKGLVSSLPDFHSQLLTKLTHTLTTRGEKDGSKHGRGEGWRL